MKGKKWIVVAFVVSGILYFGFQKVELLSVRKIEVRKDRAECVEAEKLVNELSIVGKNILSISVDDDKALAKHPCIKSIEIKKKLPNKILLLVNGRKPLVRVAGYDLGVDLKEASPSTQTALLDWSVPFASSATYFLADDEGVVFATTESTSSAIFYLPNEDINVGKRFDMKLFKKFAEILTGLNHLSELVSFGKVIDSSLLIGANEKIVFGLSKEAERQVASLQLILGKAKIDGRLIESIDLRFEKPVVVYKGKNL